MMKKISLIALMLVITIPMFGQIAGRWNGLLKITESQQLRIVFNITDTDGALSATILSPDQSKQIIPMSAISFIDSALRIENSKMGITYIGKLDSDTIRGEFSQNGLKIAMNLSKGELQSESIKKRPQEPIKPYPYISEDVTFTNSNGCHTLAGTLTMPKDGKKHTCVVLITGSGPQNRDEDIMGHKIFLVLSDHLTRNGISVLRFDDRGFGKSTGDFKNATTADLATDVEAAVEYLKTRKEIDNKRIGLIGHSEGGMIAPIVASRSKDIKYIVLLAGTGVPGDSILLMQQELIARAEGVKEPFLLMARDLNRKLYNCVKNDNATKNDIQNIFAQSAKMDSVTLNKWTDSYVKQFLESAWMRYFINYNPADALEKVKTNVLILNGEKDLQVPCNENISAIEAALKKGGNKKFTSVKLPNQNHLFQECKTGSITEYEKIEESFSPKTLRIISDWIIAL